MNLGCKLWVLGSPDPEMRVIGAVLNRCGQQSVRAATHNGRRANARQSYQADRIVLDSHHGVVLIECRMPVEGAKSVIRVDHHAPGDPGYGQPPARYWEASSIGQVFALLEIAPTRRDRMVAAADHCLSAAYRGLCPGVDPGALMRWRLDYRARVLGVSAANLLSAIEYTRARLREMAVDGIADLTREPRGTLPEAPEAAAREGLAVIARVAGQGATKTVFMGHASPARIAAWMEAERRCGKTVYGDPDRGFAGSYREQREEKPDRDGLEMHPGGPA